MLFAKLRFSAVVALGLVGALGVAGPARAQDSQAENIAAARSLGIEGVQLAEAGKCDQAIEKLNRAESLYHAPTILDRLGECQVNVGQIVVGSENLNRVVREQLAANAPKAFRDAQARAQKALDAALPRIAHLTVLVEPKEAKITVTVGGTPVPPALIGAERPTDPGMHEVVASAPGYITQKTSVTLAEAGRQTVTLSLPLDPNAPKEGAATTPIAPVTPPPVAPPPAPAASSSGSKTLAYVLIGTGVAGVAVGSITGAMALQKKGELSCPQNHCSGRQADTLDSAKSLALVSSLSFGVGILSGAIGTVILLTSGSSHEKAANAAPKQSGGFGVTPYLGVASAGVTGVF
jgi:hypothetical protein